MFESDSDSDSEPSSPSEGSEEEQVNFHLRPREEQVNLIYGLILNLLLRPTEEQVNLIYGWILNLLKLFSLMIGQKFRNLKKINFIRQITKDTDKK